MNQSQADADLWDALQVANVPVLLAVLAHATGEERWLRAPFLPSRTRGMDDNDTGGLAPELQDEVRRAAFDVIRELGGRLPSPPTHDRVAQIMSVSMGETVPIEYAGLMLEEMGFVARNPEWPATPDPRVRSDFFVVVIGAGVSGVCASVALTTAGIPHVVVERSDSVGGTWWDNQYPGCGVDTPSHLYSYSFARHNWSRYFAARDEIRDYVERCVDEFAVRSRIMLDTEVLDAAFDDAAAKWRVRIQRGDGSIETLDANAVISAVGQLNVPSIPDLPGAETFRGPSPHAARWPQELDTTGKRVAVIGTGATAMQLVPAIADRAEHVTVFQRSPQWAATATNYKREVPWGVRHLMSHHPIYAAWYRSRLVWSYSDKVHESLQLDPGWEDQGRSINRINAGHRRYFTSHIESELADRPDLLDKAIPDYPPFAKRMLIDNDWFKTLRRDNVALVDSEIVRVQERGLLDGNGAHHEADVLVYATGFQTLRMAGTYEVRGREGVRLRSVWGEDDARAHLGINVPGFPNFFCLYGPNTNLGHGGSLILLTEAAMRYVVSILQQMITCGVDAVEVRREIFDQYNRELDETLDSMVWALPGVTNWYRNSAGRVVTNMPWRVVDYWRMTHDPKLSDFRSWSSASAGAPSTAGEGPHG